MLLLSTASRNFIPFEICLPDLAAIFGLARDRWHEHLINFTKWQDRAENVNMCMLFVVYDKIGLRWRGHYILNDEKM